MPCWRGANTLQIVSRDCIAGFQSQDLFELGGSLLWSSHPDEHHSQIKVAHCKIRFDPCDGLVFGSRLSGLAGIGEFVSKRVMGFPVRRVQFDGLSKEVK